MKRVYLDHAATTPVDPHVEEAMRPFWGEHFGNAGGLYEEGRRAKEALGQARIKIAKLIGARPDEIIFTSGGTESDNLAVFGVAGAALPGKKSDFFGVLKSDFEDSKASKPHIITAKFEHHAVLHPCQELEKLGFSARGGPAFGWDVTYLEVGEDGIVSPENVKRFLRPETVLVSIMYANNEIGTIQPVAEIGKIIHNHKLETKNDKLVFHTDACQSAGYLDLNVNYLGVDLMTVNGSKIYGPKGVGFLYVRRGVKISPQILGGVQEMGLRAGTEPVALNVGLASAFEIAQGEKEKESARLTVLRDYFIGGLEKKIPKAVLNGHPIKRLPNNINISIPGANGEEMVVRLDANGIACSTGSACTSESSESSHVILALGRSKKLADSSLRLTMGRSTTKGDLDYVLKVFSGIINSYGARN